MSADKDARPDSFPADLASCHAMLAGVFQSLTEKDQRIGQLEELVEALIRERSGRKSERYAANQIARCWRSSRLGSTNSRRGWFPRPKSPPPSAIR